MARRMGLIDEKIKELGEWRGKTLAKVREIGHRNSQDVWIGVPR
jgi:hypothetical protein